MTNSKINNVICSTTKNVIMEIVWNKICNKRCTATSNTISNVALHTANNIIRNASGTIVYNALNFEMDKL